MARLVATISSLAMLAGFLIIAGQSIPGTAAQTETTLAVLRDQPAERRPAGPQRRRQLL
jgi:hypothetical protein